MSSLLYHSISSGLTEDKMIEIDKRVAKDRELAYLFIKNLPSNLKDKTKRLFVYVMFLFLLSQPLVPYAAAVCHYRQLFIGYHLLNKIEF